MNVFGMHCFRATKKICSKKCTLHWNPGPNNGILNVYCIYIKNSMIINYLLYAVLSGLWYYTKLLYLKLHIM